MNASDGRFGSVRSARPTMHYNLQAAKYYNAVSSAFPLDLSLGLDTPWVVDPAGGSGSVPDPVIGSHPHTCHSSPSILLLSRLQTICNAPDPIQTFKCHSYERTGVYSGARTRWSSVLANIFEPERRCSNSLSKPERWYWSVPANQLVLKLRNLTNDSQGK